MQKYRMGVARDLGACFVVDRREVRSHVEKGGDHSEMQFQAKPRSGLIRLGVNGNNGRSCEDVSSDRNLMFHMFG